LQPFNSWANRLNFSSDFKSRCYRLSKKVYRQLYQHLVLKTDKPIDIGTFKIWAFELNHDVPAYGFIIKDTTTSDKLLFINDTEYVRWDFKDAKSNEIMIECNHNYELINKIEPYRARSIKSHMELGATIKTLKKMNLSATNNIYLMHLSDGYSDQELMMTEVQKATGKPTYICLKNGGFI